MNPYLLRLRAQFDELRTGRETILAAADAANDGAGRDLTTEELAKLSEMRTRAEGLVTQIDDLTADETRSAAVAATAAATAGDNGSGDLTGDQTRGAVPLDGGDQTRGAGGAQTQPRDPGHYRQGGEHSFFGDLYHQHIRSDEGEAATRLVEHQRALSTPVSGAGLVPPKWLTDRYEGMLRQGRALANAVTNIPLAGDPRPMTIPGQTGGTDAAVAEQATENTHPSETDGFATGVDTITPKATSGMQVFSRQMLDMCTPAIDALIFGDLTAVYNLKVENKVLAAWVAAAQAYSGSGFANEAAFQAVGAAGNAVIQAAIDVWDARYAPADIAVMNIRRWGAFNQLRDSTGRTQYPNTGQSYNIDGVGNIQAPGSIEGLPVVATKAIANVKPENIYVGKAADTLLFEGDLQRFRFEEVAGPESIKLGIWAYTAVSVRRPAASIRKITITA